MKLFKNTKIYSLIIIILIISLWQLMVNLMDISSWTLPSPTDIFHAIVSQKNVLIKHSIASFVAVIEGFIVGGFVGIMLGIMLMYYEVLNKSLMPILVFLQTMPKVAIAPLIMVWFGLGDLSKVVLASTIVFFSVMINTMDGLRIRPEYYDLARVYKANDWQIMLRIRLRNALPNIFTGLRIGTTLAVIGVTVAEFVGSQDGLGHLMVLYQAYMKIPEMFAAIVVLSIFGYIFYELLKFIEKILLPWYREE